MSTQPESAQVAAASSSEPTLKVVVVGATGYLGRKVVAACLHEGYHVRALVRDILSQHDFDARVELVSGNMLDPATLETAFDGQDAVIDTAASYSRRRKGDRQELDLPGHMNVVNAVKAKAVKRLVFQSITACERARNVPHFIAKYRVETYAREQGIGFVSVRAGAFLDQSYDMLAEGIRKGALIDPGKEKRYARCYTPDLALVLALAAAAPDLDGKILDVSMSPNVSEMELAAILSRQLGRRITVSKFKTKMVTGFLSLGGVFSDKMRDIASMLTFFASGEYVPATEEQLSVAALLGRSPELEDSLQRYLRSRNFVPPSASSEVIAAAAKYPATSGDATDPATTTTATTTTTTTTTMTASVSATTTEATNLTSSSAPAMETTTAY